MLAWLLAALLALPAPAQPFAAPARRLESLFARLRRAWPAHDAAALKALELEADELLLDLNAMPPNPERREAAARLSRWRALEAKARDGAAFEDFDDEGSSGASRSAPSPRQEDPQRPLERTLASTSAAPPDSLFDGARRSAGPGAVAAPAPGAEPRERVGARVTRLRRGGRVRAHVLEATRLHEDPAAAAAAARDLLAALKVADQDGAKAARLAGWLSRRAAKAKGAAALIVDESGRARFCDADGPEAQDRPLSELWGEKPPKPGKIGTPAKGRKSAGGGAGKSGSGEGKSAGGGGGFGKSGGGGGGGRGGKRGAGGGGGGDGDAGASFAGPRSKRGGASPKGARAGGKRGENASAATDPGSGVKGRRAEKPRPVPSAPGSNMALSPSPRKGGKLGKGASGGGKDSPAKKAGKGGASAEKATSAKPAGGAPAPQAPAKPASAAPASLSLQPAAPEPSLRDAVAASAARSPASEVKAASSFYREPAPPQATVFISPRPAADVPPAPEAPADLPLALAALGVLSACAGALLRPRLPGARERDVTLVS